MTYGSFLFVPYRRWYSWEYFWYSRSRCRGSLASNSPRPVASASLSRWASFASKSPGWARNSARTGVTITSCM